jgi:hypothetical protein
MAAGYVSLGREPRRPWTAWMEVRGLQQADSSRWGMQQEICRMGLQAQILAHPGPISVGRVWLELTSAIGEWLCAPPEGRWQLELQRSWPARLARGRRPSSEQDVAWIGRPTSTRGVVGRAGPARVSGAPSSPGSPSPGHGAAQVPNLGQGPRSGVCLAVPFWALRA